jgi:hypothetical protein
LCPRRRGALFLIVDVGYRVSLFRGRSFPVPVSVIFPVPAIVGRPELSLKPLIRRKKAKK